MHPQIVVIYMDHEENLRSEFIDLHEFRKHEKIPVFFTLIQSFQVNQTGFIFLLPDKSCADTDTYIRPPVSPPFNKVKILNQCKWVILGIKS